MRPRSKIPMLVENRLASAFYDCEHSDSVAGFESPTCNFKPVIDPHGVSSSSSDSEERLAGSSYLIGIEGSVMI